MTGERVETAASATDVEPLLAEVRRLTAVLAEAEQDRDAFSRIGKRAIARAERAEAERDHLLATFYATCPEGHEHGVWCGSNWAALKAERDAALAALAEVRALHEPVTHDRATGWVGEPFTECRECRRAWPCPTSRVTAPVTEGSTEGGEA